jgi:hypothetical protein
MSNDAQVINLIVLDVIVGAMLLFGWFTSRRP